MAKELDEHVESFRTRPMDAGPYTFIAADALVLKARQGGRVVNVHARLATGVNADGRVRTAPPCCGGCMPVLPLPLLGEPGRAAVSLLRGLYAGPPATALHFRRG